MTKESLLSISPIDGRYKNKIKELENYFSEFALIKTRVEVEIRWLLFLLNTKSFKFLPSTNKNQHKKIEKIYLNFNLKEASKVKSIEKITKRVVRLEPEIDPNIIAGIELKVGSFLFNSSINSKLESMKNILKRG